MDLQNLTLFAAAGSLVAFWNQIKGFLVRISSIVIRSDTIQNSDITYQFLQHILPKTKLIQWGNNTYIAEGYVFPKENIYANLIFTYFKSYPALYNKFTPILLSEDGENRVRITYLAGTFPIKKILEEVSAKEWEGRLESSKDKSSNFYVIDVSGSDKQTLDMSASASLSTAKASSPPEALFGVFSRSYVLKDHGTYFGHHFKDTQFNHSVNSNASYFWSKEARRLDAEITFWRENVGWYRERGLSWRRGALIYGPAGSGKTKVILECAKKHGLPVRRLNISNMSNSEFTEAFNYENREGQIVLIEDIDSIFVGRENILAKATHTKQLVSFDTLINAIGGIKTANGSFVIITTNHPEKLDDALTRSGRLDAKIEIGPLCAEGRKFIAANILRDWQDLLDRTIKECDGMVAAEFENHCIELAIQEKNKERERN